MRPSAPGQYDAPATSPGRYAPRGVTSLGGSQRPWARAAATAATRGDDSQPAVMTGSSDHTRSFGLSNASFQRATLLGAAAVAQLALFAGMHRGARGDDGRRRYSVIPPGLGVTRHGATATIGLRFNDLD